VLSLDGGMAETASGTSVLWDDWRN
jgi:hypothetical protein